MLSAINFKATGYQLAESAAPRLCPTFSLAVALWMGGRLPALESGDRALREETLTHSWLQQTRLTNNQSKQRFRHTKSTKSTRLRDLFVQFMQKGIFIGGRMNLDKWYICGQIITYRY